MKPPELRHIVPIALLMLAGVTRVHGQNVIKNGSFEKFTGNDPGGWVTSNIPNLLVTVSPSPKCHGGKLAVRCEVKDFHGTKMGGMIMQKDVEVRGKSMELVGYYVLKSVGKDVGFISLELQNADGNTVKICNENLVTPAAEFTRFRMAGDIPAGAVRLDVKFALLAGEGSESLHEGTYLLLDDLEIVPTSPEAVRNTP